jgi:hypothetical protein
MAGRSIDAGCPVSRDSEASIPFCSGVSSNGVCSIITPYQGNDWAARLSLPPQSLQPCRMGFTRYIDDLGNSGQLLPPKAWHAHGNAYIDVGHFYPNLAKVGKGGEAPFPSFCRCRGKRDWRILRVLHTLIMRKRAHMSARAVSLTATRR